MLKKIAFLFVMFSLTSCNELQNIAGSMLEGGGGLTTAEIGGGLKEALNLGVSKGADRLSLKDGFFKSAYKVLLPPEAQKVTQKLQNVPGFSNVEGIILEKINRGAEDAAKKAKPIFISAIKQMTFKDAMNILMGDKNAATTYLKKATYNQLYKEFSPVINNSLDKFKARQYWNDAVNTHNKIPFVKKVDTKIEDHVTKQALKGLFSMVEKEEQAIRTNVSLRPTDLLKKVFAQQDNK